MLLKTLPLFILILFYIVLTAFRDLRDNYARELWDGLGYAGDISVYSTSELVVAFLVLIILASVYAIKDNLKALLTYHGILLFGTFSVGIATFLLQAQLLNPFLWMVISGFGLYICYVPFNALFFDRFIAAFRIKGNAGFLIYLADAFGYLGSMAVLLYKNFGMSTISWLKFFINGAYWLSIIGSISVVVSFFYLRKKHRKAKFNVVVGQKSVTKENDETNLDLWEESKIAGDHRSTIKIAEKRLKEIARKKLFSNWKTNNLINNF